MMIYISLLRSCKKRVILEKKTNFRLQLYETQVLTILTKNSMFHIPVQNEDMHEIFLTMYLGAAQIT